MYGPVLGRGVSTPSQTPLRGEHVEYSLSRWLGTYTRSLCMPGLGVGNLLVALA